MKKEDAFLVAFNMVNTDKGTYWADIELREFFIMILVCYLFEKQDVVSMYDVRTHNKGYSQNVSYVGLRGLESKGYLKVLRTNRHFSKYFLELTDKGLLFKSKMFRLLNRNL